MHGGAYNFVAWAAHRLGRVGSVVEFGSRDVNGSVRPLFAAAGKYVGIDIAEGPGVDVVADCGGNTFESSPEWNVDVVVCCETLEHTPKGRGVCRNAHTILKVGGLYIVTAAGAGREPHSAVDGGRLRPGEYYGNVSEGDMREWLKPFGFSLIDTFANPTDIYALAVKVAHV